MKSSTLRKVTVTLSLSAMAFVSIAQVTTATISGFVRSSKGEPLPSATVKVEFPNTGMSQTLTTRADGRFTLPNLRVGGPYRVSAEHVSHEPKVLDNIFLELGLNNTVEFSLEEKSMDLAGVTVSARSAIFDNKRTGASTNISSRQLKTLPTISRSADDFLRIAPSASANYNGISFAGRNGQYNNFSLDGAVFNNPFGLDAPTPGGQTSAQPVSLDAIDQIQVNIAPYDVTQAGFTGAGVNTVTKSGNNITTGTIYGFYRNEGLTGKKVDGKKLTVPDLRQTQVGAALGGPVIKNKLFYFLSFETEQRTNEASAYKARNSSNAGDPTTSRVLEQDLIDVSNALKSKYGYETGPYQGFTHDQTNYKWLTKFDWNISGIHRLSFTYNGLDASKDKPAHPSAFSRRGPDYTSLQFRNSGYEIVNKLHSFSTELKSNWQGNYANKLRLVYTSFRDRRNPFSAPFPVINISKYGVGYIAAGHEPFSIHNRLSQDAFQVTNDFNIYKKDHNITVGASFESFKFANSFNLTGYGFSLFGATNMNDFDTYIQSGGLDGSVLYARNRAAADKWTFSYLTVGQLSAYAQDEWQIHSRFRLTYGLRADMPIYFKDKMRFSDPSFNNDGTFAGTFTEGSPTLQNNDNLAIFDANGNRITNGQGKDLDNTRLPEQTPLFSPRLGFNWDVQGDKTLQLRGGSGLFTGRFPFVWIGNHINNPYSGFYNATDKDFKWPQVWRSNLGADFRIEYGTIFSLDVAYTKDVKAMMVRNYNLGTPTGALTSGTGDTRRIYQSADKGTDGPFPTNVYVFTNTNKGYQFNLSGQAQQTFTGGLFAMVGYNFLLAEDASSISAEISSDAFDRNPILNNANEAVLTPSLYGNKHRFIAALSKKFEYGDQKKFATTISFFGSSISGDRFVYVYGGDINNDGTSSNDILYVPTDAEIDIMNFTPLTDVNGVVQDAAAQRTALKQYIGQDDYLNELRGDYTEKYGGQTPWFTQVDMRILQDFVLKGKKSSHTIQFSIDVLNLGNMISSEWGIKKYATTSGYFQPLTVSLTGTTPTYQFDPSLKETFSASPDLQSRWQMQFGLRYIF